MDLVLGLIDFIIHIDEHLRIIIENYGVWTYGILFLIVFAETGFVVTPFLPGDSLIFAAATFSGGANPVLNPWLIFILLTLAGILGDTVNYTIGNYIGPKVFERDYRFLKREYLEKTQAFYDKHGGKTIILARFIPIIRTFAPFVAGVGTMKYSRFVVFNVVGAIMWVSIFTFLGFFFGNIPAVEENFTVVILAIIFISILPPFIEYGREKLKERRMGVAPVETAE